MWFNSTQREEPYLGSNGFSTPVEIPVPRKGVESRCCMAVVSSCREMLGLVPQRAQPLSCVAIIQLGTRRRPPAISWRKVGMTSSPHGLYVQGYTRATMDGTNRRKPARGSQSEKTVLSSDCRLQLACMKLESLVMADQHAAVNTFPGLVHTARHITKVNCTRSLQADPQGGQRPKV